VRVRSGARGILPNGRWIPFGDLDRAHDQRDRMRLRETCRRALRRCAMRIPDPLARAGKPDFIMVSVPRLRGATMPPERWPHRFGLPLQRQLQRLALKPAVA
jgi:hypothetical protein